MLSPPGQDERDHGWVRTWGASPQAPDASVFAVEPFADATLRQVVRLSGGGSRVRIRFTNEYGTAPLTIGAAHVGLATRRGGIQPCSGRALTFSGRSGAVVPAGAPILSDPVDFALPALSRLSIRLYLPGRVETCTSHGSDLRPGWSIPGDATAAISLPDGAAPLPAQALISAVEVLSNSPSAAIVALGDSLTVGTGSTRTRTSAGRTGWPSAWPAAAGRPARSPTRASTATAC